VTTERVKAVHNLKRWRQDPIAFVNEVFGAKPDAWQEEVLAAIVAHQRVALKACKGPGKSCVMSWIMWWFLAVYPHSKILATSITGDNLRDNLWAELSLWQKRSRYLTEVFEWTAERLVNREHPETWFASARTWSKNADKTQQANTLAGLHGPYTLVCLDEVGDIPAGVAAAADASLSTGTFNRILIAGNPTQTEGPLYDACTRDRARWWVKEISGDPNDPLRAPRINKQWAQEQIDTWGADNPWVMVNVFGKFPPTQSNKLLGPEDVGEASKRSALEREYENEPIVMGLDVARFGDDRCVLYKRQGRVAYTPRVWRDVDTMSLADQVARYLLEDKPDALCVDSTGIGGGVQDRLAQMGFSPIGIDFGSSALDARFADRRSEMWWNMHLWIKKGQGCIPNDPELRAELTGPTYGFTTGQKITKLKLESKDDMKKRGLTSPDKADALALTFAIPVKARLKKPEPRMVWPGQSTNDYNPFDEKRG
jgi:phage terminase large subunit